MSLLPFRGRIQSCTAPDVNLFVKKKRRTFSTMYAVFYVPIINEHNLHLIPEMTS